MTQVSNQMNTVLSALASSKRLFELLDEEVEIDNGIYKKTDEKRISKKDKFEVKGNVEFNDVSFSY